MTGLNNIWITAKAFAYYVRVSNNSRHVDCNIPKFVAWKFY